MGTGKKTIFGKSKSAKLAKIISVRSPGQARNSARKLYWHAQRAKSRKSMTKIQRAALLTAARSKAIRNKKNLSMKERKQFVKVQKTYSRIAARVRALRNKRYK